MHKIRHNPVWTVLVFCRWWSVNFGKYLHWMYFVWMEAMKKDYRRITSRDGCQTAWVARIWWYFHRFLSHQKETWRRFQPFFTGRQTASICGVGDHIMMFFSVPKPDQSRWTALWHAGSRKLDLKNSAGQHGHIMSAWSCWRCCLFFGTFVLWTRTWVRALKRILWDIMSPHHCLVLDSFPSLRCCSSGR